MMARRPFPSRGAHLAALPSALLSGALLSAALLVAAPVALAAQERGSLVGVVVDDGDGAPLPGASVSVVDLPHAAAADETGKFLFPDVPAGILTLKAEAPGYSSVVEQVEVTTTDVSYVRLRLLRVEAILRELMVRAGRSGGEGSETEIRGREDDSRTAADLLAESVPGVEVTWGSGSVGSGVGIRIRGVSSITQSNAPAVYLDGIRVDEGANRAAPAGRGQRVQHILETIPASEVNRIRVLRGPSAAARYGDAVNGVILIETRRGGEPE